MKIKRKDRVHKGWKERIVKRDVEEEQIGDYIFKNVDIFKKGLNGRRKKRYKEELKSLIKGIDTLYYPGKGGKKIHYSLFKVDSTNMVVFNK